MMRFVRVAVAGLALPAGAVPALAALPPQYQEQREIAAIRSQAAAHFPEGIEQVEKVGPDRYRVRSGPCTLDARIVDVPVPGPRRAGPRHFRAELGPRTCSR